MAGDIENWMKCCKRCLVAKAPYTGVKVKQGTIIAKNPMELVCIDFTKMDPSARGEENVLVITDAFNKFTQCVVTPNQEALTVAKVLVDKWFIPYGVPARLHSDKGKSFDNEIIAHLCKICGIQQSTTTPYNPRGNGICERFNRTLHGLL